MEEEERGGERGQGGAGREKGGGRRGSERNGRLGSLDFLGDRAYILLYSCHHETMPRAFRGGGNYY